MARVKRGVTARRRHKKVLKQAKGYYHARRKVFRVAKQARSEEHTSELQSLMRISYAVFCLKKKKHTTQQANNHVKILHNRVFEIIITTIVKQHHTTHTHKVSNTRFQTANTVIVRT